MATVECPNYEINLQMCPCTSDSCERRGICCLCVQNHRASAGLTACMKQPRPAATLGLSGTTADCPRREETKQVCACTYDPCSRLAVCCECLRNHWTADGSGRPACFN